MTFCPSRVTSGILFARPDSVTMSAADGALLPRRKARRSRYRIVASVHNGHQALSPSVRDAAPVCCDIRITAGLDDRPRRSGPPYISTDGISDADTSRRGRARKSCRFCCAMQPATAIVTLPVRPLRWRAGQLAVELARLLPDLQCSG